MKAGFGGRRLLRQVKAAALPVLSSVPTPTAPGSLTADLVIQVCTTERFTGTTSTMCLCTHAHPAEARALSATAG